MPHYTEQQKLYILQQMGYDPNKFEVTDNDTIRSKVTTQPTVSGHTITPENVVAPKYSELEAASRMFINKAPAAAGVGTGFVTASALASRFLPGWGRFGALGAGLLGGALTGAGVGAAQKAVMPKEYLDEMSQMGKEHPYIDTGTGLATIPLGGMSPGIKEGFRAGRTALNLATTGKVIPLGRKALTEASKVDPALINAELQNLANVGAGSAIVAGMGAGHRAVATPQEGETRLGNIFDPKAILSDALTGYWFNKPNVIGRKIMGFHPVEAPGESPRPGRPDLFTTKEVSDIVEAIRQKTEPRQTPREFGQLPIQTPVLTKSGKPVYKTSEVTLPDGRTIKQREPVLKTELGPYKSLNPAENIAPLLIERELNAARLAKTVPKEGLVAKVQRKVESLGMEQELAAQKEAARLAAQQKQPQVVLTKGPAQPQPLGSVVSGKGMELRRPEKLLKQQVGGIGERPEARPEPLYYEADGTPVYMDKTTGLDKALTEKPTAKELEIERIQEEFDRKQAEPAETTVPTPGIDEVNAGLKKAGVSGVLTPKWFQKMQSWGAFRGVKLDVDNKLVDSVTGKPIGGIALLKQGVQDLVNRVALVNPNKGNAITAVHEPLHFFLADLANSPRPGDRARYVTFKKVVEQSKELKPLLDALKAKGYKDPVEELLDKSGSTRLFERLANLKDQTNWQHWWADFKAHLKYRYNKSNLNLADVDRLLGYEFMAAERFKPGEISYGLADRVVQGRMAEPSELVPVDSPEILEAVNEHFVKKIRSETLDTEKALQFKSALIANIDFSKHPEVKDYMDKIDPESLPQWLNFMKYWGEQIKGVKAPEEVPTTKPAVETPTKPAYEPSPLPEWARKEMIDAGLNPDEPLPTTVASKEATPVKEKKTTAKKVVYDPEAYKMHITGEEPVESVEARIAEHEQIRPLTRRLTPEETKDFSLVQKRLAGIEQELKDFQGGPGSLIRRRYLMAAKENLSRIALKLQADQVVKLFEDDLASIPKDAANLKRYSETTKRLADAKALRDNLEREVTRVQEAGEERYSEPSELTRYKELEEDLMSGRVSFNFNGSPISDLNVRAGISSILHKAIKGFSNKDIVKVATSNMENATVNKTKYIEERFGRGNVVVKPTTVSVKKELPLLRSVIENVTGAKTVDDYIAGIKKAGVDIIGRTKFEEGKYTETKYSEPSELEVDRKLYEEVKAKHLGMLRDGTAFKGERKENFTPEYLRLSQQIEDIKRKYKGMPPGEVSAEYVPKQSEPSELRTYQDLTPEERAVYSRLHTEAFNARNTQLKRPSDEANNALIDAENALDTFQKERGLTKQSEPSELKLEKGSVRNYLFTEKLVVHGVDNLDAVKSILETGIRPGTQMSSYKGQGLESGAYVLVYPKNKFHGQEVSYRPGDYLYTRTRGKPIEILFDTGFFVDKPTEQQAEAKYNALMAQQHARAKSKYGIDLDIPYTPETRDAYREAYSKYLDAIYAADDRYAKNLNNRMDDAMDTWDTTTHEGYRAMTSEDYYQEIKQLAESHGIPTRKIYYDDAIEDFSFTEPKAEVLPKTDYIAPAKEEVGNTREVNGILYRRDDKGVWRKQSEPSELLPDFQVIPSTFWERYLKFPEKATVSASQVFGRLRNSVGADSLTWDILKMNPEFMALENSAKRITKDEFNSLLRKGDLKVTVETYGMEGKVSEAKKEYDRMTHEWYDTLSEYQRTVVNNIKALTEAPLTDEYAQAALKKAGLTPAQIITAKKYVELRKTQEDAPDVIPGSPRATSAYGSVSALPTNEPMPEWTTTKSSKNVQRVDVVIPRKKYSYDVWLKENEAKDTPEHRAQYEKIVQQTTVEASYAHEQELWRQDNLHENLPNTVGWTMIQYTTGPKGEKIAVIDELQSRWWQTVRNNKELLKTQRSNNPDINELDRRLVEKQDHPLLRDYNRLILKAAIAQAKKEGATHIVVSDAETAMMTEGHDAGRVATIRATSEAQRIQQERDAAANGVEIIHDAEHEYGIPPYIAQVMSTDRSAKADAWIKANMTKPVIEQEPGMRLNYDTILPKIAEELTGNKGERVSLGEHKNAYAEQYDGAGGIVRGGKTRENLIFRNPDGTPKTDVSGMMYDITGVSKYLETEPFTLGMRKLAEPSTVEKGGEIFDYAKEKMQKGKEEKEVKLGEEQGGVVEPTITPPKPGEIKEPVSEKASFLPFLTSVFDKVGEVHKTPTGKLVTDKLHQMWDYKDWMEGQIGNRLVQATKAYTPDQITKVYKHLWHMDDEGKSPLDLDYAEKDLSKSIIELVRYPRQVQIKEGLLVKAGKKYREAGVKPEGYIFNMLEPEAAYNWANKPANDATVLAQDKAYIAHQVKHGVDPAKAAESLHEYKAALGNRLDPDATFAAIRRAEGNGLPWELVDKNFASAAVRYGTRAARDLAYFKYIQSDPRVLKALNLKDQFGKYVDKTLYPDTELLTSKAVSDAMLYVAGADVPTNPKLMAAARVGANTVMGVGTATRNLVNVGSFTAQYVQVSQLPLVWEAFSKMNEARVRAFESNAIKVQFQDFDAAGFRRGSPDPFIRYANEVSYLMRRWQGRDLSDRLEGAWYYTIGELLATDNIARAKQGNKESQWFVNKFGETVEGGASSLLKRNITQEDISRMAKRFVDSARGTYGPTGLPSWAMKGNLAPFAALSRFSIEKSNTIWKDVIQPARHGIYGPLLRYTLASLGVGAVIDQLNDLLSHKRGQDLTINEALKSGSKEEILAKAVGLFQFASTAGIMSDLFKVAIQAYRGKDIKYMNQPLSFPLYTLVTDTLARNTIDAAKAIREGEDPFEVLTKYVAVLGRQSSQTWRYIDANFLRPDEAKRKEKFRDYRVWQELEGTATPSDAGRPNEFLNMGIKEFKREEDIGKAAGMLPDLIKKALEDANGNPDKLRRNLLKIKLNNYQTMPNPETMPFSFTSYVEWMRKTQGADKAAEVMADYFKKNAVNKAKSELVPTF